MQTRQGPRAGNARKIWTKIAMLAVRGLLRVDTATH